MVKRKHGEGVVYYTFISLFIVLSVLLLKLAFNVSTQKYRQTSTVDNRYAIILDAGHGGKDGGAVSVTGTYEEELNLKITLCLSEILHLNGYNVILTRTTDTELTHESGGSRKMQDLKGRLEISLENPEAPFISIHMNKFPQGKYSGLQVYYSKNNDSSLTLAKQIQDDVRNTLQKDNDRKIKGASSAIYLLDKITAPAVLIECGFLSNTEEAELLDTPEYQAKLASVIAGSITRWYNPKDN